VGLYSGKIISSLFIWIHKEGDGKILGIRMHLFWNSYLKSLVHGTACLKKGLTPSPSQG